LNVSDKFKAVGKVQYTGEDAVEDRARNRPKGDAQMKAKLDLIGIVVEDMEKSLAYYRELGLEIPDEPEEMRHVETTLPGGLRLAWDDADTVRSFDPEWKPATGGPAIGLAFRLDTPAEVDALYKRLVSLGYDGHKEPWDAPWGQRYALVRDPDGNSTDLFSPL
jgi:catechol 2,3-dioxygenase-like lactoylglutathione lyase family enzyme